MCEKKDSENMFSGLLLGGLIGVALGIVFAPLAGEEARSKIKKKLDEFDFGEIAGKLSEAFEAGTEEFKKVADKGEGE